MPIIGTPTGSAGYEGRYTSAERLKARFGAVNISAYSDTESTGVENTDAIQSAIVLGEAEVDHLLAAVYLTPLVFDGGDVDEVVANWATVLATYNLYTRRGLKDEGEANRFEKLRDAVLKEAKLYRMGIRKLAATKASGLVTGVTGYVPRSDINGNLLPRP